MVDMFTTNDEWIRLECGQCKYFKADADMDNVKSTCKRLDHKHLRFAKKTFLSYDCGQRQTNTCSDFEPNKGIIWLCQHWNEVKEQIISYKENDVVLLNVDKNTDIIYAVDATEFYNNTFVDKDGTLRWVYKYYYKQRHICIEKAIEV